MDSKVCYTCKANKPIFEYKFQNKLQDKLQGVCRSCHSEYRKKYYRLNRAKYIKKAQKWNTNQKQEIRNYLLRYLKKHPCVDCGEKDIIVLDFDHRQNKKMAISTMLRNSYSIRAIEDEIKKCEVRCSNCHRRKTSLERNDWRVQKGP